MDSFSLKAQDICKIIEKCSASGVSEFEFQGMRFTFHPRRNEDAATPGQASDHTKNPVVSDSPEAKDDQQIKAELMDNEALLEAEEAQLLIDDPLAFEKAQISRHLERQRTVNERT